MLKSQTANGINEGTTSPERASPAFKEGHWFWKYIKENRRVYYQVIMASILINIFALVSSLYIMTVYDRVIPNNAIASLITLTIIMIIVMGFDFVLKILRGVFVDHASSQVDRRVSADLFNKISSHSVKMSKQATGAVANTVRDFELLKEVIGSASFTVFADLPFVFLFIFVLFYIGGPVATVPALIVPIVILFGLILQPLMRRLSEMSAAEGKSKQAVMVELLSMLETVKTVRGISILRNRWYQGVLNQGVSQRRSRFTTQLATHFTQLGQQASQVGIVVWGVFLITSGDLTMGQLIACVILSGRTLAPLGQITGLLGRFNQAVTAYKGLSEVMNSVTEEEQRADLVSRETLTGDITFKGVSMTYEGRNEPTLKDCNLNIKSGERVAILGRIGSGKSTLLSLISGVHQASSGAVMLDNVDIRNLRHQDIRNNIGVVLQNPMLFSGTVRENLLMGKPDATDKELLKAAEMSGAGAFIGMLPNGFDFLLSERGQELSAGMRQSLAIARAMIGEPSIYLMDEPTSSMDSNTEMALVRHLDEATKGKTAVFVTHRGLLVSIADRIVVVEAGQIVIDGPRDAVLKKLKEAASQAAQTTGANNE
jgi:ATP-binding cassette subfamily C protein LapB